MTDPALLPVLQKLVPQKDGEPYVVHRTAIIDQVNSNGTVDILLSGVLIPGVPCVSDGILTVGRAVSVLAWAGGLLVLGSPRTSNSRPPQSNIYTSNSTYQVPPDVSHLEVWTQAGGGAGGGRLLGANQVSVGGGGGGGGGNHVIITNLPAPGTNIGVVVGAGGTGVSGASGGNGGTSSFGSYTTCTGGAGGNMINVGLGGTGSTAPAAGGTASHSGTGGGGENSAGQTGTRGFCGLFASTNIVTPGAGGGSMLGAGAQAAAPGQSGTGYAGRAWTGEGASGLFGIGQPSAAGPNGGSGRVFVVTYFR